ncbi:MAG TPA: hypothetical protein VF666_01095 [Pyrinomonadaceae bacterium]|jgi:16S rRNA U516 pseudouridylate synthase RsuA-like enzyme
MPTDLIRKQFLLNEAENEQIEAQAAQQGLSVSNLTRLRYGLEPLEMGGKRSNTGRSRKTQGKRAIKQASKKSRK